MGGEVDETRGRVMGRPWFLIGLALVVAATIPLVLADDVRYMRLGIVAALWAALIGAFLAVRYRRQATTTEEVVAQAQEVYELELEREIAARREFELEVEAETRQRVEAESRSELDALRAEIASLRDNLQNLFGGEVLLERVALTAQATRMRSLNEEQRVVESGVPSKVAQIAAARKEAAERPTEFIERVREKKEPVPVRVSARPMAPEPRRAERSMDLPPRRTAVAEPVDAERTRVQPAAKKPERPQARPVEPTRPVPSRPERIRGQATTAPVKRKPEPVEEQTQVAKALGPEPAPRPERQASDLSAAFPTRTTRPVQPAEPKPAEPPAEPESSAVEPVAKETAVEPVAGEQPVVNETLPVEVRRLAQQGRLGRRRRRAEDDEPVAGRRRVEDDEPVAGRRRVEDDESPAGRRRVEDDESPAGRRRAGDEESPAGRRRRPERDEATPEAAVPAAEIEPAGEGRRGAETDAAAAEEAPVGRRHRPDGEPPSWMSTGRRAAPAGDEQPRGSRRAAVDDEQPRGSRRAAPADDAGSHSNGRSVSELLAANGKTATPRRRRRAED